MTLEELRATKRDAILAIAARHGVKSLRVFGSFARGEARDDSDLDLLIEAGPQRTFFFPGGLVADLEEVLQRRVDVVEEKGLHIKKPERGKEHHKHNHRQERTDTLIPKGSKRRKCKHGKVSDGTDRCDRNASDF